MSLGTANDAIPRVTDKVKDQIRRRIQAGWKPGTRLPPIADLARQFDAGLTNTHRAVKQLVTEGLLVSHPGLGTYVSDSAEAGPKAAPARPRIDIILSAPQPTPVVRDMLEGLHQVLQDQTYEIRQSFRSVTDAASLEPVHLPADADAVVLINPDPLPRLTARDDQSVVIVKTGAENPLTNTAGYDFVSVDHQQGASLAGAYVREHGLKRPCFIGHRGVQTTFDETSAARLGGFERGFGAMVDPAMQLSAKFYTLLSGARAFAEFVALPSRPDVVFLASDDLAIGFALAAESQGVRLGEDVRVIGFDGQPAASTSSGINLTSVAVPFQLMGRRAAELLIERLVDPAQPVRGLTLGCTLKPGNSC